MNAITRPTKKAIQYTFAMIKPDVAMNSIVKESILSHIEHHKFEIIDIKNTKMDIKLAKQFYSEHEGKFFYNRLVTFMSSCPIYALILSKEDAITSWRSLIGKTNVYKTIYSDPDCLRSKFGLSDTRNALHGSDSEKTFVREASFFFSDFIKLNSYDNDN